MKYDSNYVKLCKISESASKLMNSDRKQTSGCLGVGEGRGREGWAWEAGCQGA